MDLASLPVPGLPSALASSPALGLPSASLPTPGFGHLRPSRHRLPRPPPLLNPHDLGSVTTSPPRQLHLQCPTVGSGSTRIPSPPLHCRTNPPPSSLPTPVPSSLTATPSGCNPKRRQWPAQLGGWQLTHNPLGRVPAPAQRSQGGPHAMRRQRPTDHLRSGGGDCSEVRFFSGLGFWVGFAPILCRISEILCLSWGSSHLLFIMLNITV